MKTILRWVLAICLGSLVAEDRPLEGEEAARSLTLPDGFTATLFAGEPDIVQPINFCIDDRGRLWVCEAHNYPKHGETPGDRIVILEDLDHDGKHDKRTVFYDQLNYVTGIEVGFGGVWVMSPPRFLFIPDQDGDDKPDGPPQVLLDGFGNHANSHNLANGFAWGPDGWLYGTHGRTNWSMIGKVGAEDADRTRFDGGVWRYHPVRHVWEPFCDGTTNPWGIDWNEVGEAFITNCVNPHLFHAIQGAHYEPWRGRQSSQYAYRRIDTIADHLHYVSAHDVRAHLGSDEESSLGGGHAHCGVMIYQGGQFPKEYQGAIFMNNIHGKRINLDLLRVSGSGYQAGHGPDFAVSKDPWFMGVTLQYGPDGSVYVSDWSDTGECHSTRNTRKETGRIFRISYGESQPKSFPFPTMTAEELGSLLDHPNQWVVRHARRNMQERASQGQDLSQVLSAVGPGLWEGRALLERLWARHVTGLLTDAELETLLEKGESAAKGWAIRLLAEDGEITPAQATMMENEARGGTSPAVRLQIASALQRLPPIQRWALLEKLANRGEDETDQNLPLMIWYALEPLMTVDRERFTDLVLGSRLSALRQHGARRLAEDTDARRDLGPLLSGLPENSTAQSDVLAGLLTGLQGVKDCSRPTGWETVYRELQNSSVGGVPAQADQLALIFGDQKARLRLKEQSENAALSAEDRVSSLRMLADFSDEETSNLLMAWAKDPVLRQAAIQGLAKCGFDPEKLIALYPNIPRETQLDLLQTLASRKESAAALMNAVETQRIASGDIPAFTARQIASWDAELARRIRENWGDLSRPAAEKRQAIERYLRELTPETIAAADVSKGRFHFQILCAACHKLFGEGGSVGPELTGSQRTSLEYWLENLIDPSAAVSKDFQMHFFSMKDGRLVSGFVASQTEEVIVVQSINERITLNRADLIRSEVSKASIMPEGLFISLPRQTQLELLRYLSSPQQVGLAKE